MTTWEPTAYDPDDFANRRHIGPSPAEIAKMLDVLGVGSVDELIGQSVPTDLRQAEPLSWAPMTEGAVVEELRRIGSHNTVRTSMIGQGYHQTVTPPAIQRNILENPAWYSAYTPYQPEISQGRLEALLNFQTMIGDLTGLPTANASLLDEGTAAAEAMTLVRRANRKAAGPFVVDADALPQTIAVVRTRAEAMLVFTPLR